MKRALAVIAVPLAIAAACSESADRAPPLPACTGTNCGTGPGVVSSNPGNDSGTPDSATDGAFEVGDGGVGFTATVRPLSKFVTDPYSVATFDTAMIALRAPRAGGGTDVEATMPVADGSYTLSGVAPSLGSSTYIEVVKSGVRRTLAGVNAAAAPPTGGFSVPLFAELLAQTTWNSVVATTAYPTGAATVVVHIYRRDSTRKPGVRAAAIGGTARGPYYDDGTDITATAAATGANATIVFLGITGAGTVPLTLTDTTTMKNYDTVLLPVAADAVTHLALALE